MKYTRDNYTKIGLLLFLYNITPSEISVKCGKDRRKYVSIIDGVYQRIEKDVVSDLCNFLNVSVDTVLDDIYKNDAGMVYISNKDMFIPFNEYIFFRYTEVVVDTYDQEKGDVIHNFNYDVVNEELIDKKRMSYLLKIAKERPLVNSNVLRLLRRTNYATDNKLAFYKAIKPYLLKFLTEEEIEEKAKGIYYKELVKEANKDNK